MTKKLLQKAGLAGPRNFIEFQRANFSFKIKKELVRVEEPVTLIEKVKIEKKQFVENNRIPRNLKRESKLLETAAQFLPDEKMSTDKDDIDEEKVAQWLKAIENIDQELLLPVPKKTVKTIIKKTVKEPVFVYPIAHQVKDRTKNVQKKTVQKLSRNPWGVELVAACVIALIVSVYISRLAPGEADQIIGVADSIILSPIAAVQNWKYEDRSPDQKIFSQFIINNKDNLRPDIDGKVKAYTITTRDLFGQVAGAQEENSENPETKSVESNNITSATDKILKNSASAIKTFYQTIAEIQSNLSSELKNRILESVKK